jgi:hypothetical protein
MHRTSLPGNSGRGAPAFHASLTRRWSTERDARTCHCLGLGVITLVRSWKVHWTLGDSRLHLNSSYC